jgi:hypothetical protein
MPVVLTGPAPQASPRGGVLSPLGFCAVCAAQWKADAFVTQSDEVTALDKDRTAVHTVALKAPGAPALAVAYGLAQLPGPPGSPAAGQPVLVPLPLCWTHLPAVQFLTGGLLAAPPGAVLLDGSGPR